MYVYIYDVINHINHICIYQPYLEVESCAEPCVEKEGEEEEDGTGAGEDGGHVGRRLAAQEPVKHPVHKLRGQDDLILKLA